MEKQLADQKQRVMTAFQNDHDKRSGDTPIIVTEARQGEQGVRCEQGPMGPAGNVNLDPVLREMHQRLDQQEAVRRQAKETELSEEIKDAR